MNMRYTMEEARQRGFTIDTTVYPHIGYKGPRFMPTQYVEVFSVLESVFLEALRDRLGVDIKEFIKSL